MAPRPRSGPAPASDDPAAALACGALGEGQRHCGLEPARPDPASRHPAAPAAPGPRRPAAGAADRRRHAADGGRQGGADARRTRRGRDHGLPGRARSARWTDRRHGASRRGLDREILRAACDRGVLEAASEDRDQAHDRQSRGDPRGHARLRSRFRRDGSATGRRQRRRASSSGAIRTSSSRARGTGWGRIPAST
ncbi:hypothetical protein ACVWZ3_001214 [Bradyrhizobium sp. i1.3.6]